MSRKARKGTMPANLFRAEQFLRSINLCYDAEAPERIAHFRPTAKSVTLIRAILAQESDRAFFIIAPYGSGKSLTATYLLHLIENRPESAAALKAIEGRLFSVSPELGRAVQHRRQRKTRGLVLALHGHLPDVAGAIKSSALEAMERQKLGREARPIKAMPCSTIEQAVDVILAVKDKCRAAGLDRISILWDESGRHIESLIAQGRASELGDIQLLAEYVTRSANFPITLGLTLHQNLIHYAGQMSQSVRTEWNKIAARFRSVQYVDDSKEIYRLISEVIEANRGAVPVLSKQQFRNAAVACKKKLGLFTSFSQGELTDLLERSYPLEPVALYVLPRVSARVAQNERTLFTFLYGADATRPISVAALYDYFSPAMRADTAVGGTHKQWLETQSAISKTDDDIQTVDALKTACLLGLGTSGERARASHELLLAAMEGYNRRDPWGDVIDGLVKRNLLLHRKHSNEVSVWHGTDADLRGRLEEEKQRHGNTFPLIEFLCREAPADSWKPLEYNSEYGVCRYWGGEYVGPQELREYLAGSRHIDVPVGCDGKILYLIAENHEQLAEARRGAQQVIRNPQVIAVVPASPLPLRDAALEVSCLIQMQNDTELVGTDPLVLPEIQQMLDDARGNLQRMLNLVLHPSQDGPRWYYQGKNLHVADRSNLLRSLSELTQRVFSMTPKIRNEMVVRRKPSGTIVNSRKKLLMGVLERHGQENLGIRGRFPDYSMFRTVLLHTGLYRPSGQNDGRWGYASPPAVQGHSSGIGPVWSKLHEFFREPSDSPKEIAAFLDDLRKPPYGVREGLLPILFAVGLKAFAQVVSLTNKGNYVTDILPSVVEDLCRDPQSYRLLVLDLDEAKVRYLRGLHKVFSPVTTHVVSETEIIRLCFDAIQSWRFQLPAAALTSRSISPSVRTFQMLLSEPANPVKLLLTDLPNAAGCDVQETDTLLRKIESYKKELESVTRTFVDQAIESVRNAMAHVQDERTLAIRDLAKMWAHRLPGDYMEGAIPAIAKGLLARLEMEYDTDDLLIDSLSLLIVGKSVSRWDDSTAIAFDGKLRELCRRIEEVALSVGHERVKDESVREGLGTLVQERIQELYRQLISLVGEDKAEHMVAAVLRRGSEVADGNA